MILWCDHPAGGNARAPGAVVFGMKQNTDNGVEGPRPLVYQASLSLSTRTLTMVADGIRARRKKIRSRWRKIEPADQALLVLAHLRHDQRYEDLAVANGVSTSTIGRWVEEVIAILAAKAPRLDRILKKIRKAGGQFCLIDGTFVPTRRRTGVDNRRNYRVKKSSHGLLFLGVTDDRGNLRWISQAFRGGSGEVTDARRAKILGHLRRLDLGAITDMGFTGLDDDPHDPVIVVGKKKPHKSTLTDAEKDANRLISRERAANEHGFGDLKLWRCLAKLRRSPKRATALARALLVLTASEIEH
jgi:DDE superfamily endonuclease/Helix-turn-helix of DDE superfamily endonuclease